MWHYIYTYLQEIIEIFDFFIKNPTNLHSYTRCGRSLQHIFLENHCLSYIFEKQLINKFSLFESSKEIYLNNSAAPGKDTTLYVLVCPEYRRTKYELQIAFQLVSTSMMSFDLVLVYIWIKRVSHFLVLCKLFLDIYHHKYKMNVGLVQVTDSLSWINFFVKTILKTEYYFWANKKQAIQQDTTKINCFSTMYKHI